MNITKTAILLAALTALFMTLGFLLGGMSGALVALAIAAAMNLFAYWNSDKLVLRMYSARAVDAQSAPGLHGIVRQLAERASMPMPKVYIIESEQPNAFATGRNPENAAVAATTGLLSRLSNEEVAGVMAHELAHVKNRDTLTMTVTATVAGAVGMLANFFMFFGQGSDNRNNPMGAIGGILIMILAPLAATFVQMAISRAREYEADKGGAEICGNPLWLANALEKLEAGAQRVDNHVAEANPATAHLFIVSPLHMRAVDGLFASHPRTAERVRRLREMAGAAAPAAEPARARGPWG